VRQHPHEFDNRSIPGHRRLALGALIVALLAPGTVSAQTAELRGAVADSTGSALPGVTVTIVNVATGVERVVVTDDQGTFRVPALQPGPYTVESTLSGFGPDNRKVTLTVGQVADVKVALSVGAIEESIQVVGRAAVEIETTKSDLSAVVSQEQLSELPVLNRGFVGLAQLLPGGGPARTGDGRFGISTSFGGTNVRSMYSMQIDGGIMDHPIYGFAIVNVSQDAVQEFRVLRNQFDAEFSRAGTAVVNVVTRSGTNEYAGRLSYFGRDDSLNAKNAFARTKPLRSMPPFSAAAGVACAQGLRVRHPYNRQNSAHHCCRRQRANNGLPRARLGQAKVDYTAGPRHPTSAILRQRRHRRGTSWRTPPRLPGRVGERNDAARC
jgi:hypothetical protein